MEPGVLSLVDDTHPSTTPKSESARTLAKNSTGNPPQSRGDKFNMEARTQKSRIPCCGALGAPSAGSERMQQQIR
jgi:hypothetical protein